MQAVKKVDKIALVIAVVIVTFLVALYFFRESRLNRDGIYVIGTIASVDEFENGYWTKIKYQYKGKSYTFTYNALPKINDKRVFLKISATNPNLCKLILDVKVPGCLLLQSTPLNGWDKIPNCNTAP